MKHVSGATRKIVFAVLIGPLAFIPAFFLASIVSKVFNLRFEGFQNERNILLDEPFAASMIGLVYSYPMTIFFGVPAMLLLKSMGVLNIYTLILVGSLGASIVAQVISWPSFSVWLFLSYFSTAVCIGCWYLYKNANL